MHSVCAVKVGQHVQEKVDFHHEWAYLADEIRKNEYEKIKQMHDTFLSCSFNLE